MFDGERERGKRENEEEKEVNGGRCWERRTGHGEGQKRGGRERQRETERETERQADRQTERQTERRERERERERERDGIFFGRYTRKKVTII